MNTPWKSSETPLGPGRDAPALATPAQLALAHSLQASSHPAGQPDHANFDLRLLATLVGEISLERNARAGLGRLMVIVRDLIPVEAGTLFRLDRAAQQLIFAFVLGPYNEQLSQQRLPLDRGLAGWVARHGEALRIDDARHDPRFHQAFDQQTGFQTRSVLCVPLLALGETCGVLQLINRLDGAFTEHDLHLLKIIATISGLLLMLDEHSA